MVICASSCNIVPFDSDNYTYKLYGKTFKKGECCEKSKNFGDECKYKYVTFIPQTQSYYCKYHYKEAIKSLKISQKQEQMNAKLASKKERENKLNEKKKLLEEKKQGFKKQINANVENIIENQDHVIQQYISEEEVEGCNAILKTGQNKGKLCGCKKIENNGLCKRHSPKVNVDNK